MWRRIHSSPRREAALKVKVSVISRSRYLPSVCCGFLSWALKQKQLPSVGLSRYTPLVEMRQQLLRMTVKGKVYCHNSGGNALLVTYTKIKRNPS